MMNLHHSFHKNHRLGPLKWKKSNPSVLDSVVVFSDIYFFKKKKANQACKERKSCLSKASLFSFSDWCSFCLKKERLDFFGSFFHQGKNEHSTHHKPGTNQLDHVEDAAGDVADAPDIDSQASNNYRYNLIGQLVRNDGENVEYTYNTAGLG